MGQIVSWNAGTSEAWVAWFTGGADDAIASVGEVELADPIRAAWAEAVLQVETQLVEQSLLGGGIWVPDRSDGPWGQLTVRLVVPDPSRPLTPEKLLKSVRKPRKERGTRVFDYSAAVGDEFAVGPAVVQVEVRGYGSTGVVRSQIAATVFPAGTSDVLRLEFVTNRPAAFEALSEEALTVVESLTVEVQG